MNFKTVLLKAYFLIFLPNYLTGINFDFFLLFNFWGSTGDRRGLTVEHEGCWASGAIRRLSITCSSCLVLLLQWIYCFYDWPCFHNVFESSYTKSFFFFLTTTDIAFLAPFPPFSTYFHPFYPYSLQFYPLSLSFKNFMALPRKKIKDSRQQSAP